jgi:hypothetical protein
MQLIVRQLPHKKVKYFVIFFLILLLFNSFAKDKRTKENKTNAKYNEIIKLSFSSQYKITRTYEQFKGCDSILGVFIYLNHKKRDLSDILSLNYSNIDIYNFAIKISSNIIIPKEINRSKNLKKLVLTNDNSQNKIDISQIRFSNFHHLYSLILIIGNSISKNQLQEIINLEKLNELNFNVIDENSANIELFNKSSLIKLNYMVNDSISCKFLFEQISKSIDIVPKISINIEIENLTDNLINLKPEKLEVFIENFNNVDINSKLDRIRELNPSSIDKYNFRPPSSTKKN